MQLSSSSSGSAKRPRAFNLDSALDAYEVTCARMVSQWKHMGLYARAGEAIAAIRDHGLAVPALTVLTVQLAIAHCELESALWRKGTAEEIPDEALQAILSRHAIAVQDLRLAAQTVVVN